MRMNDAHSLKSRYGRKAAPMLKTGLFTLFLTIVLMTYILPLSYMFITAFKDGSMLTDPTAPLLWPAKPRPYTYEGKEYSIYSVPEGEKTHEWALVVKEPERGFFIDPLKPEKGLIEWTGRWRTLEPVYEFSPAFGNFTAVLSNESFVRALINTVIFTFIGVAATLFSSLLVAYGFARFKIPYQELLFMLLIGSLLIPRELIQIPLYTLFSGIGWVGTWLPLLIPQFFSNALYVFLLRQHFKQFPKHEEDAALMEGAGPFRILFQVFVPQSGAVIATVVLLQFFFLWKDLYLPTLYLGSATNGQLLSSHLVSYSGLFGSNFITVLSASLLVLIVPVVIFLLTQSLIMKGAVSLVSRDK
ncbi:MAG: carbohydrate ABC transporter permease [Spirochaetales bacterium]|nr:carbohydrate ABC transporter permease [Spirochaetales bacterium]